MAPLVALILFILAAFGIQFDAVNIWQLGLAFLALAFLLGNWPFSGFIERYRR